MVSASYGVLVEGSYDEPVFAALIPRICGSSARVFVREAGGRRQVTQGFPGLIRILFEHVPALNGPVERVVVVRDANGVDPAEAERRMYDRLRVHHYQFRDGVRLHAVRRQTETWLLADSDAVSSVARQRGGRGVDPVPGVLEDIADAKGAFRRLLSEGRLRYTPQVCGEIAAEADLVTLRSRCPSFRRFEQVLL